MLAFTSTVGPVGDKCDVVGVEGFGEGDMSG